MPSEEAKKALEYATNCDEKKLDVWREIIKPVNKEIDDSIEYRRVLKGVRSDEIPLKTGETIRYNSKDGWIIVDDSPSKTDIEESKKWGGENPDDLLNKLAHRKPKRGKYPEGEHP